MFTVVANADAADRAHLPVGVAAGKTGRASQKMFQPG
jgi:hypothetical protein